MILSPYNKQVEIIGHENGSNYVTVRRVPDGREVGVWRIDELNATGGAEEIAEAIARVETGGEETPA